MSKTRLVITAVTVEHRSVAEVVCDYGVSRSWVYELLGRYRQEGEAAFKPRSRRPHTSPRAAGPAAVERVLLLRKQLAEAGLDAGADTIGWHLSHHHGVTLSRATINRILTRAGALRPDPSKRPRSSYVRFAAEQPNECWQADVTHYRLTRGEGSPGAEAEILSWLDDHARYALSVTAHHRVSGPVVLRTFQQTCSTHGVPASTLTDNGMVFTTRLAGGKGGRNAFEHELRRLGVTQKNSRPNHPTTCGKVERFQQTLKNWLRAQPDQPATTEELQVLLNRFVEEYNHHRPHRSLPHRATPATGYAARPKAGPGERSSDTHNRVRSDRIDKAGKVTLRHAGRLYSIGVGRTHARTRVLLLVEDLHIRIIDAATGELLRELILDPTKRYQPTGRPPGPTRT